MFFVDIVLQKCSIIKLKLITSINTMKQAICLLICFVGIPGITDSANADSFQNLMRSVDIYVNNLNDSSKACAQGNDQACASIGYDPNDPCRQYFGSDTNVEYSNCQAQACNEGNQFSCAKIQRYNQYQSGQSSARTACERDQHAIWNGAFCQRNMR